MFIEERIWMLVIRKQCERIGFQMSLPVLPSRQVSPLHPCEDLLQEAIVPPLFRHFPLFNAATTMFPVFCRVYVFGIVKLIRQTRALFREKLYS